MRSILLSALSVLALTMGAALAQSTTSTDPGGNMPGNYTGTPNSTGVGSEVHCPPGGDASDPRCQNQANQEDTAETEGSAGAAGGAGSGAGSDTGTDAGSGSSGGTGGASGGGSGN